MGPWRLRHTVGQGSFAVVWRAEHSETGEVAAVKEINTARLSPKLLEGLQREIAVLQRARHPHIVRLHSIFRRPKAERLYLVLEYCAGGDLAHHVRQHGRVAESEARVLTQQLASGLRCLRQHNLMHRDLKPQNLLLSGPLDAGGVLKIADFGFARDVQEAGLAETLCGSPLYMAPEILQNRRYGVKADLWSVGAVLFELVSGKPPYGGMNHLQLLRNIETKEARLPLAAAAELSPECCDLISRLLKRNPLERLSFESFFSHGFVGLTEPPGPAHAAVVVERNARRAATPQRAEVGDGADNAGAGAGPSGEGACAGADKVQGALVVRPARSRQNSQNGEQPRVELSEASDESSLDREYVFIDAEGAPESHGVGSNDCGAARVANLASLPDSGPAYRASAVGSGVGAALATLAAPSQPGQAAASTKETREGGVAQMALLSEGLQSSPSGGPAHPVEQPSRIVRTNDEAPLSPLEELEKHVPRMERAMKLIGDLAKQQEAFLDALSLYLLAAKVAHAAIGALKATRTPALPVEHVSKQQSLSATAIAMAEAAQAAARKLTENATDFCEEYLPDSVELVYQHALGCARQGAVDEMLGNIQCRRSYEEAEVLLRFLCSDVPNLFPGQGLSRSDQIRIQEYISHINSRRGHALNESALAAASVTDGLDAEAAEPLQEQLKAMNMRL